MRYGNVVGSRGSVIPLFLEQRKTGKVTVTDPTTGRSATVSANLARWVIHGAVLIRAFSTRQMIRVKSAERAFRLDKTVSSRRWKFGSSK